MITELSIIIPALNEEKYLPKLLNSIALQDFNGKLEIIVVDGNSEDKTVKVAENFKNKMQDLTILKLKKQGISYQRNRGAEKAKYTYLLFLDADMILPQHFLTRFLKRVNTQDQFVITTNQWIAEKKVDIMTFLSLFIMYPVIIYMCKREKILPGFLFLTTKELHQKIHGFREDLRVTEDIDYGWRAIESGAKFHLFLYPRALYSTRRMVKIGAVKFFYLYLSGFRKIKKNGLESVASTVHYPLGQHGEN